MPSLRESFLCAICCATLALASVVPAAHAQAPLENTPIPMWVPDGPVADVVKVGNTLVVGGGFDYVGPPTGTFAIVDATDATSFNTASVFGSVAHVVPDGSGGWIVSGSSVPNTASTLTRVGADGTRDPGFVVPTEFSSPWAMTSADGQLFAANGVGSLAKFNALTGARLPWTPAVPQLAIHQIVVSGGVVYASSDRYVDGNFRSSAMAFDASTGAVVAFPALQNADVAAAVGNRAYVVQRTAASHTLSAYNSGQPDGAFASTTLAYVGDVVASPTHVYVRSGFYSGITQIVALDAATGATLWTSPHVTSVFTMAIDGNTLFVGGGFMDVGGAPRSHLAAFDATTGALLPWAPMVGGPGISNLAVTAGRVAIGGGFGSVGGIVRRGLVSLDLATGRPTQGQPPSSNYVGALATAGDLVVVATASFLGLRSEVFAYSAATGVRFSKSLEVNGALGRVVIASLALNGSTLFMGGFFDAVGGAVRRNLAAYDLAAGQMLPWNPSPDSDVRAIKVHAGALYAVGKFTTLPGYGRNGAVSFDLASLEVTNWNPQHGGLEVYDLDTYQDRVFLGVHVRDEPPGPNGTIRVVRTLAVDRLAGATLNIDLPIGPEIAQVGGTLAVAGNGSFRVYPLATFDALSGQALPWAPAVVVAHLSGKLIGLDGYLVFTGSRSVGPQPVSNLAVFKQRIVLPGAPRQIQMTVVGSTVSLAWSPGAAPAPLSYVIEAGSGPGLSDLGRFSLGGATQVAAAVAPGSYALRIRAIGASGEGPASSEWLFTTPATNTPPATPSALVGSVMGNVVSLGWNAAAGNATTYVLEGGTAPGISNLGVLPLGSLDTAIAGAVPSGTYFFRMRAANASGASPPSNEIVLVVP